MYILQEMKDRLFFVYMVVDILGNFFSFMYLTCLVPTIILFHNLVDVVILFAKAVLLVYYRV